MNKRQAIKWINTDDTNFDIEVLEANDDSIKIWLHQKGEQNYFDQNWLNMFKFIFDKDNIQSISEDDGNFYLELYFNMTIHKIQFLKIFKDALVDIKSFILDETMNDGEI